MWASKLSRSVDRGQGQADVPAEQPTPRARSRLPSSYAYACRSCNCFCASRQRPQGTHRLNHCSSEFTELGVLPEPHRLHRSADFSRAVRRGRRMGRQDLVVHAYTRDDAGVVCSVGEPRFGLIVSKAVGPAVTRHRVARRLRHICAQLLPDVPSTADVVIRALPGSAGLSSADLHRQVRSGLKKLGYLETSSTTASRDAHS